MVDEMVHKNRGHKVKSLKGKVNRRNSIRGTQGFAKPSPTVDNAKVQINSENAISLLQNLKTKYNGICKPHGFINDLRVALGIPTSKGASKYGTVTIPTKEGVLECSICIANHNATAENYVTHNSNYPYNLRLLIRNQFQSNRFHPHPDVKLDEYVYYGKKMEQVDSPLCQIIDSLIGFLQTGEYKDTTGVAFLNQSPQADGITQDNNKENINCNRNMNKNRIRLTESQLQKVIKESVRNVLNEGCAKYMYNTNKVDYEGNPLYGTHMVGPGCQQEYTAKEFEETLKSVQNKLACYNDRHMRLLSEMEKLESEIQELEEYKYELEHVVYGSGNFDEL